MRPADVPDFLNYCSAWHMTLKGHHDAEEEVYFPGIEKATGVKGIMDSEVHEHGQQPPKPLPNWHASRHVSSNLSNHPGIY